MAESPFRDYIESLGERFRLGDVAAEAKLEEAANIRAIENIVLALGRGDFAAVTEMLDGEVRLEINSSASLPFIHSAHGKAAFLEATLHNFGQLTNQQPVVESVVAQGDTVVIISRETGEVKASGTRYDVRGVHRYVFREGKVTLVEEFLVPA